MSKKSPRVKQVLFILVALLIAGSLTSFSHGSESSRHTKGQTVYVPLYSNIFVGDKEITWQLSALLSVRNTDPAHPITIKRVEYYDSDGKLVRKYLEKSKKINPMASAYFYVKTSDTAGGWGANFLVEWTSEKKVNEPIVESLMSGMRGNHSVSFISPGRVIEW
jgi:hypothetical protein